MMTPEEFINGRKCENPGCNTFVKLKKQWHSEGLEFKIWQCPECGWVSEYSGPSVCPIHHEPLSYVADGSGSDFDHIEPIFECIKCMVNPP